MEAFLAPFDVLGTEPSAGGRAGLASDPRAGLGSGNLECSLRPVPGALWASDFPLATGARQRGSEHPSATAFTRLGRPCAGLGSIWPSD